ncbi:MAG: eukaryotic-like serine/threonine-protein kinase, partial [Ilumatobacteraceae bacterium]
GLVAGGIVLFNVLKNDPKATSFPLESVVGLPLDEATKKLQDAGLAFNKIEQVTPAAVEGAVVETRPAAGTIVTVGQAIDVLYNPIKTPVPIPDVKGQTVEQATATLTGAGFTVSPNPVFVVDSTLEPGKVLSTDPPFGQSAKQGTVVTLAVSKAPDQVGVPEVTGQDGAAAKALLEAEPYTFVVTLTPEPSADVPANVVIRTDPPVNTPVAKGASINVIVSAGPAKVRVPPVEGLTEAAARNQLTNRGLVADVQFVTVAIGSADDGHVISQSIPSTDSVLPGTTIKLKVGKAAPVPSTTVAPTSTTIPATTTTPPTADLSVTITDGASTKSQGSAVTYTIVASNAGPSSVSAAFVSDIMPSGLSGVTWTCSSSGSANCPSNGNGNINAPIDLSAGGSVTFIVSGTVSMSSGSLTNTVTISTPSGVNDPAQTNNSASDTDTVTP